jgi:hypothetical protein
MIGADPKLKAPNSAFLQFLCIHVKQAQKMGVLTFDFVGLFFGVGCFCGLGIPALE